MKGAEKKNKIIYFYKDYRIKIKPHTKKKNKSKKERRRRLAKKRE
jgi:hypothetical protein